MFAVPGCVYLLESVFFLNVRSLVLAIPPVKGFASFLLENWTLFFRIGPRLACHEFIYDLRVKFGKQECGSLRHITLNPR